MLSRNHSTNDQLLSIFTTATISFSNYSQVVKRLIFPENAEGVELPKLGVWQMGGAIYISSHQRPSCHPAHTPNPHPGLFPECNLLKQSHLQGSSIPDRVESHGYSPFKVDFKQNKVEWALARVDDLVNWGRKARRLRLIDEVLRQ